jgi:cytochrome P450
MANRRGSGAQACTDDLLVKNFADPYPYYRELRATDPVHWNAEWNAWVLTKHRDILSSFHERRFSSEGRMTSLLAPLPSEVRTDLRGLEEYISAWPAHHDPPGHTRLRDLIKRAFTPRAVERMRPRIHDIVDQMLRAVEGQGRMDVIRDIAYPLPATVIAEMIGVPAGDREFFKKRSIEVVAFLGVGGINVPQARRAQRSLAELSEYFERVIGERRAHPKDDLLTGLIQAEQQGDKLTGKEMLATCVSLLTAGHETTTNLIGNGVLALLQNPEPLRLFLTHLDDPKLVESAVEEFLRYDGPVLRNWRLATDSVEFGGRLIRKGQLVYQMLGAANRDPERFPDPESLQLERQDNHHLAFGYGIHFCLGAPLARLEAQIAIPAIFQRLPELQLAHEQQSWLDNMSFRGLKALEVRFRPV